MTEGKEVNPHNAKDRRDAIDAGFLYKKTCAAGSIPGACGQAKGESVQYSLVGTRRSEAFPGGKGVCPFCKAPTVAKCGPRVMHHWAHIGRKKCDPWWENETEWHREWKSLFPENCREVIHIAPDGEIHRADIKTSSGIVIEVQHSAMTDAERTSREVFYKNLIWVLDGKPFAQNFDIYHPLPDPNSELAKDLIWHKSVRHFTGTTDGMFYRISENIEKHPSLSKNSRVTGLLLTHGIQKIIDDIAESYCGHHQYDWVRPRHTWLDAQCPVYIDFGHDFLAKLGTYDETNLACIKYVSKNRFLNDVLSNKNVQDVANN
ncbi:competence protein CoiA [Pectobacterium carotovorum]|uniref:competence protein CoiA n=1 Tax=Pectobacterium carotovorum TaxID=554 RepID=UPI002117137C|nr:hypothetical protein [Pectobacterium carotovorum]MCQ8230571.1 hypothetical protein [Pectobacterium carotovorum]